MDERTLGTDNLQNTDGKQLICALTSPFSFEQQIGADSVALDLITLI